MQSFLLTIREHNGKDVNEATSELTSIFKSVSSEIKASSKSSSILKVKKRKTVQNKNKEWFDQDCEALYRNLTSVASSLTNKCNDANKLRSYYTVRKQNKTLIRKKQRNYKSKLLSSLVDLESKDSKTFWNVINKFKNCEARRNDPSSNIYSEEWHSYFNRLMNVNLDE